LETRLTQRYGTNIKIILLAALGMIFTILYFFLVVESPTIQLMKPKISRDALLSRSDSFLKLLPSTASGIRRQVFTVIDDQLLQYAQYFRKENGEFPNLSVGYWSVVWKDNQSNRLLGSVTYDFDGNLVRFSLSRRNVAIRSTANPSEDEALMEAMFFLESMNFKSDALVISNKDVTKTDSHTIFKFTLNKKKNTYSHLTESFKFELIGDRIVSFRLDKTMDMEAIGTSRRKKEEFSAFVVQVITWLFIILIMVILTVKRLRKDELEFRRAIWLALLAAVMVFVMIGLQMEGHLLERLIATGAFGAIAFIGYLIIFPVSESVGREVWPEKLELMDLLLQGKGAVRESGVAILRSFFLTGSTLFVIGILLLASTYLDFGYIIVPYKILNAFQNFPNALSIVIKNIIMTFFVGFGFLCFWAGYLKGKLNDNKPLIIVLLALTFDMGGLHQLFFSPPYLGAAILLPVALLWAYAAYSWDLTTTLLSFFAVNIFLDLGLLLLIPEAVFSPLTMAVVVVTVLFFGLGVYLIFRRRSTRDYDTYVPEYVSRIAEKERFLKELEIARGVQMRFLPQKVPQFPSLEIVSLCQPAMEVGGDYYDFIQVDERYMTVLIGDVSGKGVSAAFYMTMVKGIIKTLSKKNTDPATILAEANEIFYENAPRDVFITIIYGVFDLKEKILTLASAGHNPLLIRKNDTGKIEMINPKGIALGLDHGERYKKITKEVSIPIAPNDVFVFYTDGVTEAMNNNEEVFGEERLLKIVEKHGHLSPQQLQEKIVDAVSEFSETAPQHDDFTMVVVKVRPV
jgi:phosphoserine phosphatase RsbU/P